MTKILLVDDDPIIGLMLSSILQRENHELLLAQDGQQALDCLEEEDQISLIITDIMMPVMDGLALIQHIRNNKRYQEIPIIILSAVGNTKWTTKAARLGIGRNSILAKPTGSRELIMIVRDHLNAKPSELQSSAAPSLVNHQINSANTFYNPYTVTGDRAKTHQPNAVQEQLPSNQNKWSPLRRMANLLKAS